MNVIRKNKFKHTTKTATSEELNKNSEHKDPNRNLSDFKISKTMPHHDTLIITLNTTVVVLEACSRIL